MPPNNWLKISYISVSWLQSKSTFNKRILTKKSLPTSSWAPVDFRENLSYTRANEFKTLLSAFWGFFYVNCHACVKFASFKRGCYGLGLDLFANFGLSCHICFDFHMLKILYAWSYRAVNHQGGKTLNIHTQNTKLTQMFCLDGFKQAVFFFLRQELL